MSVMVKEWRKGVSEERSERGEECFGLGLLGVSGVLLLSAASSE